MHLPPAVAVWCSLLSSNDIASCYCGNVTRLTPVSLGPGQTGVECFGEKRNMRLFPYRIVPAINHMHFEFGRDLFPAEPVVFKSVLITVVACEKIGDPARIAPLWRHVIYLCCQIDSPLSALDRIAIR